MTVSVTFACGLVVTLLVSLVVVRYLSGPLRRQLLELCGSSERASFWTAFANITVSLVPVIFAMSCEPADYRSPLLEVARQLKWGLVGLVASILVLGRVLGKFLPRPRVAPIPSLTDPGQHGAI